ncbi:MAG: P-loop NTPase [bacterium]|nr:P-loop NTPase [bacterium]
MSNVLEQDILDALNTVVDPNTGKTVVELDYVKRVGVDDKRRVECELEIPGTAASMRSQYKMLLEQAIGEVEWIESVEVFVSIQRDATMHKNLGGLSKVGAIIAVSSCKGGVGKSSVAVNLAFALQQSGARVGLFDADVYGPSLPTMVHVEDAPVIRGDMVQPLMFEGVRMMSFGFVPNENGVGGAAVMRGAMVTQVISQLLTGTNWGAIDYLVLDMPPGTGDIQLTLGQLLPISAAIIVTTPQELSFVDVEKGIEMFDKLKVPTISVVENMAYFVCDGCDKKHYIFGGSADRKDGRSAVTRKLVEQFGFDLTYELPILPALANAGDSGVPLVVREPKGSVADLFRTMAADTVKVVNILRDQEVALPVLQQDGEDVILKTDGVETLRLKSKDLRLQCRCANCVDEFTGKTLVKAGGVSDDVRIMESRPVGRYAIHVGWSDGHISLFPIGKLSIKS